MPKYRIRLLVVVCILFLQSGYSQTLGNPSSIKEMPIYIDGFNYPSFDDDSHYAWFKIHFPFTETSEFNIGGEHYRNFIAERFTVPMQFKKYFSEKSYFIIGYQLEWDLRNIEDEVSDIKLNKSMGNPNPNPLQEAFFGMGMDIQPNWFMEASIVRPVGEHDFYKVGLEGVGTRLELGTKLKF